MSGVEKIYFESGDEDDELDFGAIVKNVSDHLKSTLPKDAFEKIGTLAMVGVVFPSGDVPPPATLSQLSILATQKIKEEIENIAGNNVPLYPWAGAIHPTTKKGKLGFGLPKPEPSDEQNLEQRAREAWALLLASERGEFDTFLYVMNSVPTDELVTALCAFCNSALAKAHGLDKEGLIKFLEEQITASQ